MTDTPNERSAASPPSDASRPVLDGMAPAWQFVADRFREGHTAAVLDAQDRPGDAEAQAILRASSAAVRAFRQEYERASTARLAAQIDGGPPGRGEGISR